jgi:replication factor C small subunit
MSLNPIDIIWTEKYRPKKVSELVGDFKNKILKYLENPQAIPHFLLYSKTPGTGKTSLAKAIFNELGCDTLILNSSDDRRIEIVRDRIKEFAMTRSTKDGIKRGVLCDEFEGMTKISQEALRNMMETYSGNCFFILTANAINRVIEPIQSRCVLIEFSSPSKEEIYKYLESICIKEKMDYTEEGINKIMDLNYPSIRNCVKCLQDLNTEKKQVIIENIKPVNQIFEDLWKMILDKKWLDVKKIVMEGTIDPIELNHFIWERCIMMDEPNIKILQICCRNERDFSYGCDANVVFITSLVEMVK